MVKINFNLPNELKKPEYSFYLSEFINDYKDTLSEYLDELDVNIYIHIVIESEKISQKQTYFKEVENRKSELEIPFSRYTKSDGSLTELPDQKDFFETLKFNFNMLIKNLKENNL